MARRWLWAWLAMALLVACKSGPPDELVATSKRFEPLYRKMQAIGRAYPDPASYREKPCPKGLKPFRMMAWHVVRTARDKPDEVLGPFAPHGGVTLDRTLWGPPSEYLKLPDNMAEYQTPESVWRRRQKELDEIEGLLEAKHLRAIHVVTRKEAELRKGRTFDAGHIAAWVITFDLDSGKQVCAERLTVESSDRVSIPSGSSAESSLERDLRDRLEKKLDAHEKAVAPFIVPI
ncbi:MAG: hypothetical protein R3B72_04235 [Polyangiaceae bacterium]